MGYRNRRLVRWPPCTDLLVGEHFPLQRIQKRIGTTPKHVSLVAITAPSSEDSGQGQLPSLPRGMSTLSRKSVHLNRPHITNKTPSDQNGVFCLAGVWGGKNRCKLPVKALFPLSRCELMPSSPGGRPPVRITTSNLNRMIRFRLFFFLSQTFHDL